MPSSISSHLLIRVGLSSMFLRENGSLEASISQAISPSFWKKVLSLLELRYCFFFSLAFDCCLFFFVDPLYVEMVHALTLRVWRYKIDPVIGKGWREGGEVAGSKPLTDISNKTNKLTFVDKKNHLRVFYYKAFGFHMLLLLVLGSISLGCCWTLAFLWPRAWSSWGKISEFDKWIHVTWCGRNRFCHLPRFFCFFSASLSGSVSWLNFHVFVWFLR